METEFKVNLGIKMFIMEKKKGQFHNGPERKAVKLPWKIREQSEMV